MKIVKALVLVMLLGAAFSTYAQTQNDAEVKILPTLNKGFIKVLFVSNRYVDVQVKFYNDKGLYTVDMVDKNSFNKGFLKKYDIRNIRAGEAFWVEVSTKDIVTTYKMSESKDQNAYEPQIEKLQLNNPMVASKD